MPSFGTIIKALLRRKHIEQSSITQTRLDRCLSTLDLTALGNISINFLFCKIIKMLLILFTFQVLVVL
jgi:hypothetical protein